VRLGSRQGYVDKHKKVHALARNNLPPFKCTWCSSSPEVICSICFDFYCQKCRKNHGCQAQADEIILPVVNSPRMGVCGDTGEGAF
jgi:hypothetical protein